MGEVRLPPPADTPMDCKEGDEVEVSLCIVQLPICREQPGRHFLLGTKFEYLEYLYLSDLGTDRVPFFFSCKIVRISILFVVSAAVEGDVDK